MTNTDEVDVAILGAGGAGSALLLALDRAWRTGSSLTGPSRPPRVLVVDPVRRSGDDRTWCFWHEGPHDLDGLAHRSWNWAEVCTAAGARAVLDLDPFRYVMLRSSDVYAEAHEAGRRLGARWITGVAADPEESRRGATVRVGEHGEHLVSARWIFDSRPAPAARPATTSWIQHFRGWTVRFPEPVLDVHVPTLMDLSTPQQHRAVTFGYVLPLEPDLALVEFTAFSPAGAGRWPDLRYEQELRAYLRCRWGLEGAGVRIEAVEDGVIPMSDAGYAPRAGRHVMRLGTAGGATRASTGYAFAAMYRQAVRVASRLRQGRTPTPGAAYPRRHRAFDAMLLTALDAELVDGADLFGSLWSGQPPGRLLRFLDGASSASEEWALMAAAPRRPMSRAARVWAIRRVRASVGARRAGVTES